MVGKLYMDSDNIHVEGNPDIVSGSKPVTGRDPSEIVNWWGVQQPTAIEPIPRDSAGRAMRWCSSGHYDVIDNFAKNKARKDGKDNYCRKCRKTINRRAEKTAVHGK